MQMMMHSPRLQKAYVLSSLALDEPDGELGSEPVGHEEGGPDESQETNQPPLVIADELSRRCVVLSLREEGQNRSAEVVVDVLDLQRIRHQLDDLLIAPKGCVKILNIRWSANESVVICFHFRAGLGKELTRGVRGDGKHAANDAVDVERGRIRQVCKVGHQSENVLDRHWIRHITANVHSSRLKLVEHEEEEGARGRVHSTNGPVQNARVADGRASHRDSLDQVVGANVADCPVAPIVRFSDENGLVDDQSGNVNHCDEACDEDGDEDHRDDDDEPLGGLGVRCGVEGINQQTGDGPKRNPRRQKVRVRELALSLVGKDGGELGEEVVGVEGPPLLEIRATAASALEKRLGDALGDVVVELAALRLVVVKDEL